ncbi:glycosyltransferase [Oenococcus oeni]
MLPKRILLNMNNYFKSTRPDFVQGLQLSDIVVTLTDSDTQKFRKFNPNSVTIANPITLANPDNMVSNLQGHVISWVGRSSDWQHKGTDYLLKVAANLPDDWVISVAGDKDPLTMKGVLDKADIEHAHDKIVYAGSLKGRELIQHYVNSSIFLMTSRWEGFALVVTEAMTFGLPVVLFDQTGAEAVTNHGEFGKLISTGHIDEMNQYLTLLTQDIVLRQQWQKKSLIRSKEYTLNNIIHRWTEILK